MTSMSLLEASLNQKSSAQVLPKPLDSDILRSNKISEIIKNDIQKQNGVFSFQDFMNHALYTPALGYYMSEPSPFGPAGDFITAPLISPLFATILGTQCLEIFEQTGTENILEFGAGTGELAIGILRELKKNNHLPKHYFILEISPTLRAIQKQNIEQALPDLLQHVQWISSLEIFKSTQFEGIMVANEVLDALPTHRFMIQNKKIFTLGVQEYPLSHQSSDTQFGWKIQPSLFHIDYFTNQILSDLSSEIYISEINLNIKPWIQDAAAALKKGIMFIFDYGYLRAEFYHPQRSQGTLKCFYKHSSHNNPFFYPGLQDISSHVDFDSVFEAAHQSQLEIFGFCSQAQFLISAGILDQLQSLLSSHNERNDTNMQIEKYKILQGFKLLTDPNQMGEIVKVTALSKEVSHPPSGLIQKKGFIKCY